MEQKLTDLREGLPTPITAIGDQRAQAIQAMEALWPRIRDGIAEDFGLHDDMPAEDLKGLMCAPEVKQAHLAALLHSRKATKAMPPVGVSASAGLAVRDGAPR